MVNEARAMHNKQLKPTPKDGAAFVDNYLAPDSRVDTWSARDLERAKALTVERIEGMERQAR
jgi:hypothetical protein